MSGFVLNIVRRGTYLDSVALMRLSRGIAAMPGVEEAALMMGSPANIEIMTDAGVLSDAGRSAGGGDLVIAIRAESEAKAKGALTEAEAQLDAPSSGDGSGEAWAPRTLRSALTSLPDANLALISVPGDFAVAEARKAIRRGIDAMIFSDNVAIEDEAALKQEARELGRLVMGPDCGTSIIAGTPLAFANQVPRGTTGIVGASGTGIQEVTCLIAQMGGGISHAIGVGGRDLKSEVGGISTLMAIDALASDEGTKDIVLIAKPPGADVTAQVLDRLSAGGKPAIICLMGSEPLQIPDGITQVYTLRDTALAAMGRSDAAMKPPAGLARNGGGILGLFSGGTLCAEAQVVLRDAGQKVRSNAPVAGIAPQSDKTGHLLLDLGDDEYTKGRPHPMIDPGVRDASLIEALGREDLAAILLDVVIGYGAHDDPAGHVAELVDRHRSDAGPAIIASITGTEGDPQRRSSQMARLEAAGLYVAPSNAEAAQWALAALDTG
ncbi:MAG: acyl-CoA synthetase FdrA [Silicimonas sp.]|nr:acyl-CoA synthetase FdrA [Silicimonas sp.]